MSDRESSALRDLAERVGIIPEYLDQTGKETRVTTDQMRRDLLGAMGVGVEHGGTVERWNGGTVERDGVIELAPVQVVEQGQQLALPDDWRGEIVTEEGRSVDLDDAQRLPIGYHHLLVTAHGGEAEQSLIIVPPSCTLPDAVLGERNAFGVIANLYTLRSDRNWGVGDFTDLARLAEWGASAGAQFVGVNPLHALLNRGTEVSPYSPVSRLFRNPIYIDVECVPELADSPAIRSRLATPELESELESLRDTPAVRYEQVMAVKGIVLDALHRQFVDHVRGGSSPRARAYDEYIASNDEALDRFALWMAIAEQHGANWREWPAELQRQDSIEVEHFAAKHELRIDYHRWLQFEADRQLGVAANDAKRAGMSIGLYQDLAIGTSPTGADTWAFPELFIRGASIGAPPDPYSATGQNWGLPPIDPRALRRTGYRYFIDLVRGAFRHAGALRIDHVMGLFRLFWIPEGKSGKEGAYVRYPSRDLLGILALESVRNNALVVGEDLGTVPPEVPPELEKWGVLSSKVLYFERDDRGFKPASSYAPLSLATANTHDMASIGGFWEGRDVDIRLEVGLIEQGQADEERAQRENDRVALLDRLAEERVLPADVTPTVPQLAGAVHGFLCRSPARLVGLSLDDLAGEREPVNVPGVGPDKFQSWTRKMRDPLDVIVAREDTREALRCDGRRGVHGG